MTAFDPYHRWLGIQPHDQPPHHYRLLALSLFESNPDVIDEAADRQMACVRMKQGGQYAALAAKLLNELTAARICLLDPAKKRAYDAALREQQAAAQGAADPSRRRRPCRSRSQLLRLPLRRFSQFSSSTSRKWRSLVFSQSPQRRLGCFTALPPAQRPSRSLCWS